MRKTREEKAITLIALIITIVVLLILAVVAINSVTGDGIIQHAVNAKEEYEKAQEEEQDVLGYYEQYLKTEGKTGNWVQNKTIVKNVKTGQTIEVGDYVNYVSGVSGYTDTKGWAVLGVENGNIIIASRNLPNIIKLTNHMTAINDLNKICEGYDEGDYAIKGSSRSINADDINRVTGYNPLKTGNGEVFRKGELNQYGNKVTYTMNEDGTMNYELDFAPEGVSKTGQLPEGVVKPTCINIDGTELVKKSEYTLGVAGKATSITITTNGYAYYPTSLTFDENNTGINGISKDSKAYKFLFLNSDLSLTRYWLASIYCAQMELINNVFWGIAQYAVNTVGHSNGEPGLGSGEYIGNSYGTNPGHEIIERGVRAVITLKSDVQLTKQADGSYNID